MASLDIKSFSREYNQLTVFDVDCENSANVFNLTSNLNLFKTYTKWLFFAKDLNQTRAFLMQQNINIDSKILVILSIPEEKYEIFHLKAPALQRNRLVDVKLTGNFSMKKGLFYEDPFVTVDYSMNETLLRVTTCVRVT